MSKPDVYFKFYVGDFMLATRVYPPLAVGCYINALCHYWSTDCVGIPNEDAEELQRICGCNDQEWEKIKDIIFGKLFKQLDQDGLWHQKRMREEKLKAVATFEKFSERGQHGAKKRWH